MQRRAIFEDASKATDIKQLAETLKNTEYYSALKQGLLSYEENGTTACIDTLLDKIFYEKLCNSFHQLSKREQRHAAFYQSLEEDSHILLTLLRGKNLNYDSNWLRVILPEESPNISRRTMEALLAAANFESALNIVLKGRYGTFFTKRQTPEETISTGEKAFQKAKFLHASKSRVTEVFNIGLPLAFMIQKEVEVKNLSSICLGIEEGISPEKIQGNLLFSS